MYLHCSNGMGNQSETLCVNRQLLASLLFLDTVDGSGWEINIYNQYDQRRVSLDNQTGATFCGKVYNL